MIHSSHRKLLIVAAVVLLLGAAGAVYVVTQTGEQGNDVRVAGTGCGSLDDMPAPEPLDTANDHRMLDVVEPADEPEAEAPVPEPAPEPVYGEPVYVTGAYNNPGREHGKKPGQAFATLEWLKDHQNEAGYWSAADFGKNSGREGAAATHALDEDYGDATADAGAWDGDLGVTSLALLTFLGAGYDHKSLDYFRVMRKALIWMREQQRDGEFINARGTRDQALATLAFAESYGMSGDPVLKKNVESAAAYLVKQRMPDGGWGEFAGAEADIISTAYVVGALKSASISGLEVDKLAYERLGDFLDSLATTPGVTRYSTLRLDPPVGEKDGFTRAPVATAAWMVTAILTGRHKAKDKEITDRADLLLREENLPKWERGRIDYAYWWLATQAMYQVGGGRWNTWQKPMSEALVAHQRGYSETDKKQGWDGADKLDEHGSWDAADIWNLDGRVSTTALANLCLQTYYRYARLEKDHEGKLTQRG